MVARILDLEARSLEDRPKEPAKGDVFLAHILLHFRTRPTLFGLFCRACKPGFNYAFGLLHIEGEDEVVQAQHAS